MPQPKASPKTHVGMVRTGNEDCFFSDDELGLWLVADGMGGHEAGEVASAIVSETIAGAVREGVDLDKAIQFSHQAVLDGGQHGEGAKGMGSTVVALQQVNKTDWLLAWVGDSRAYMWSRINNDESQIQQISHDHSYVQALIDAGALSPEEAENHPDKNVITQCLGSLEIPAVRVDTLSQPWQEGQKIILCSDGLSDEVTDLEIASIMNDHDKSEDAVNALVETALKNGGRDNVTVIIIDAPSPTLDTKNLKKIGAIAAGIAAAIILSGILIYNFG